MILSCFFFNDTEDCTTTNFHITGSNGNVNQLQTLNNSFCTNFKYGMRELTVAQEKQLPPFERWSFGEERYMQFPQGPGLNLNHAPRLNLHFSDSQKSQHTLGSWDCHVCSRRLWGQITSCEQARGFSERKMNGK